METSVLDQRRLLRLLRRRFPLVVLCGLIGVLLGIGYAVARSPSYAATVQLKLAAPSLIQDQCLNGATAAREATEQRASLQNKEFIATAEQGASGDPQVSVTAVDGSDVATITAMDRSAAKAEDGAGRLADAYITARKKVIAAQLSAAGGQITKALDDIDKQLDKATGARESALLQEQTALRQRVVDLAVLQSLNTGVPVLIEKSTAIRTGLSTPTLAVLGGLAGLLVGLGLGALVEARYGRIRDEEDLTGLPEYGWTAAVTQRRAVAGIDQGSLERSFLKPAAFVSSHRPPGRRQVLLICGVDDWSDVSTTVLNLAKGVAACGVSVCVVDCAESDDSITIRNGLIGSRGLIDVMNGSVTLEAALLPVPRVSSLPADAHVLPSGRLAGELPEHVAASAFNELVAQLNREHELVILSCDSIDSVSTAACAATADGAVLVVNRGRTTRHHWEAALDLARSLDLRVSGVLLASRSKASRAPVPQHADPVAAPVDT